MAMKIAMRLVSGGCALLACTTCSGSRSEDAYCKAVLSGSPSLGVPVKDLHVYGTLHHGVMALSSQCIRPVFYFSSIDNPGEGSEAAARMTAFNRAMFMTPSKYSGMFALEGRVDVRPGENLVVLVDVHDFHEVSDAETDKILDAVHASKGQ
ncbi:hypothetical protein SAMN06296058_1404 [Pseudoxanthomonas indica]|uniref:Lipoprotein n=2 Tax=Pseudoxanthomonas indica TaxID=428993 RepID=A0A1T5K6D8_9GAMM|nr:hypothetical protein GCM10007235_18670 [Pseudoxanthomonas indica]SKC59184.1 hypothetical protein SAMN06296058_1404 [Pseudoxanthomonas indica]